MLKNCLFRLRLTGALAFAITFSCYPETATSFGANADAGRIVVPAKSPTQTVGSGLQNSVAETDCSTFRRVIGLTSRYRCWSWLHKATGSASEWFAGGESYAPYADKGHFIILAPESPSQTWGKGPKDWGFEYLAINRALNEAFDRCAIDRTKLAIAGFSDGASYALSLGLANGDAFSYVIAFSPGFIVRAIGRGRPMVYIAHGLTDNVLPITSTSRAFVTSLRKNGYSVEFNEFSGGHHASRQVADQAMKWLTTAFHQRR